MGGPALARVGFDAPARLLGSDPGGRIDVRTRGRTSSSEALHAIEALAPRKTGVTWPHGAADTAAANARGAERTAVGAASRDRGCRADDTSAFDALLVLRTCRVVRSAGAPVVRTTAGPPEAGAALERAARSRKADRDRLCHPGASAGGIDEDRAGESAWSAPQRGDPTNHPERVEEWRAGIARARGWRRHQEHTRVDDLGCDRAPLAEPSSCSLSIPDERQPHARGRCFAADRRRDANRARQRQERKVVGAQAIDASLVAPGARRNANHTSALGRCEDVMSSGHEDVIDDRGLVVLRVLHAVLSRQHESVTHEHARAEP